MIIWIFIFILTEISFNLNSKPLFSFSCTQDKHLYFPPQLILFLQKGDTPLHIAIRGRSRRLAELLLRNPKDGRLLYRPNKAGETPYNIDCSHQKSILTQIFGARTSTHTEPTDTISRIQTLFTVVEVHYYTSSFQHGGQGPWETFNIFRLHMSQRLFKTASEI